MRPHGFSAALLVLALVAAGCAGTGRPDIEAARSFDDHPLYWIGESFEGWDLKNVAVGTGPAAGFTYGTCESSGVNGGCAAPLQIQIQPLCAYLGTVAATPIWKRCKIRGAPVGTIDNAPVMFTNRVQIKVYRGQGSDAGLALRALRALRSVNSVPPVVDLGDPIPPAPRGVLTGAQPCPRAGSSADIGRD